MLSLGMDIGTSTVKLVLLRDGAMAKQWMAVHHGRPFACLKKGLSALELDADTPFSLCVTAVFVPEKYLVQNWPVLAGRQVRSVCVPVRTVP